MGSKPQGTHGVTISREDERQWRNPSWAFYLWPIMFGLLGSAIVEFWCKLRLRNRQMANRIWWTGVGMTILVPVLLTALLAATLSSASPSTRGLVPDESGQYLVDSNSDDSNLTDQPQGYVPDPPAEPEVWGPSETIEWQGFRFQAAMGNMESTVEDEFDPAQPGFLMYRMVVRIKSLQDDRSAELYSPSFRPVFKSADPCDTSVSVFPLEHRANQYCYEPYTTHDIYRSWTNYGANQGIGSMGKLGPGETAYVYISHVHMPEGIERKDMAILYTDDKSRSVILGP